MPPTSVTVKLRPGVTKATLPDNRAMKANTNYVISFDDFRKISGVAREKVVLVVTMNTAPKAKDGTDLTVNSTTIPTGKKLGQVVEDFSGGAFKLVKLADAVNVTAGMSATWVNYVADTVTVDRVGGTALSPLKFAGIFNSTLTAGRYGWMQIGGNVTAAVASTDVAAGDSVAVHSTTDGTLHGAELNEIQTITLTSFGGTDSFKLTFGGVESAAIVRGTNAAATDVKAALEALSTITPNTVTVTGTTDAGPYIVTFDNGTLANSDVGPITVTSGVGCTGAVVETQKGGLQASDVVIGTATTDVSAGAADVTLRSLKVRNRHIHQPLFVRDV